MGDSRQYHIQTHILTIYVVIQETTIKAKVLYKLDKNFGV